MSAACAGNCHNRTMRQLHPKDADTLRHLRAAVLAGRPVHLLPTGDRATRRMNAAIAELERLAAQSPDSIDIADVVQSLRSRLPDLSVARGEVHEEQPWEHPAPPHIVQNAWLREARCAGYTLEALGEVAGITRERIRQLVAKAQNVPDLPPVHGLPVEPEDLPWPKVVKPWRRWPRPQLGEAERTELLALHALGRQSRGNMAVDDPRRKAAEELARRIHVLLDERHFTLREVADIVGLTVSGIRMKMAGYGYRRTPPSVKKYKGRPSAGGAARRQPTPIPHGTRSGYNRCRLRPEGACDDCKTSRRVGRTPSPERIWRKLSKVQREALLDLDRQQSGSPGRCMNFNLRAGITTYRSLTRLGLLAERGHLLTKEGRAAARWLEANGGTG